MGSLRLGLLVFVFLFFLFGSFSFAGNTFVWNFLGTQLEIGLNQRLNAGELRDGIAGNYLALQQEVVAQNQFNLILELDNTKSEGERLRIIDQYITSLNSTISNGNDLGIYEQSQIDYYKDEAKKCENPIKGKNSEFSDAVKNYNYEKAEVISKEIAELRACVAKNEVYAKAHSSYASSSKSLNILQSRADYLSKNREKIAKYYEVLKPDLLEELYNISKKVQDF